MTRISVTFASAALILTLAPSARGYGMAPETTVPQDPILTLAQLMDSCPLEMTPALARALGLPDQTDSDGAEATLACLGQ